MSPEEHNALRVQACAIVRELGACLDALALAAEVRRLPCADHAAEARLVLQHLDEAASAIDTLRTNGDDMLTALDHLVQRADRAAAPFFSQGGAE